MNVFAMILLHTFNRPDLSFTVMKYGLFYEFSTQMLLCAYCLKPSNLKHNLITKSYFNSNTISFNPQVCFSEVTQISTFVTTLCQMALNV